MTAGVFEGKVGIVTGGAQGIGRAIAQRLLDGGMTVAIADRDAAAADDWMEELGRPAELHSIPTDVTREDEIARLVDETANRFGRIDALVNNVGIGASRPIEELTLEEWNRVLAANLTSIFLAVRHAARHLRAARGAILNLASTRAFQSEPNTEAYSASKGGVVALTHALAVSLGPAIRVNCISPGWIETCDWQARMRRRSPQHSAADRDQHPVGRVGTPEDIAGLAAYLLSDSAGFITGQDFRVDGGMTVRMIYV